MASIPEPILGVLENNLNVPITNMRRAFISAFALLTLRNRTIVQAGKLAVAVHLSHTGSNTMWAVAGLIINALPLPWVMAFRLAKPVIRRRRALNRALATQLALIHTVPGGARLTGVTLEQLAAAADACAAMKAAEAKLAAAEAKLGGNQAVAAGAAAGQDAAAADGDAGSGADAAGSAPGVGALASGPGTDTAVSAAAAARPKRRLWRRLIDRCMLWRPHNTRLEESRHNEAALVYALLCARQFGEGDAGVMALYGTPNVGFDLRKCLIRFHGASRNVLMERLLAKHEGGWQGVKDDAVLLEKANKVARHITSQAKLIPLLTGLDLLL